MSFTGPSPAAHAASTPARTLSRKGLRVSLVNVSSCRESSETLIRERPAAFSPAAFLSSPTALVVMEIGSSGCAWRKAEIMSRRSARTRGSPPVRRNSRTPSMSTPIRTILTISSADITACLASHSRPSAGIQYVQRRLHLSVRDNLMSVARRPYRSIRPAGMPAGLDGSDGAPGSEPAPSRGCGIPS
ncbi:hypothetical protein D9M72_455740 [compost metagenome]